MSDFPGLPNIYDFSKDFNYSLWTEGSIIDLVNVPWDNNYRDVVKFENKGALDTYINQRKASGITISQMSYVKPNEPVRIPTSFNKAIKYNYLRVSNPIMPIEGGDVQRNYYYFILDVRYIAPETTEIVVQLDIMQTFMYDITFGSAYVERGHIGIANQDNFFAYGRWYLTVPEGLDFGGDYEVVATRNEVVLHPSSPVPIPGTVYTGFDILVVSATDLYADPGTVDNPVLKSATGTVFQGTMQGANFYIFDPQDFDAFMSAAQDTPWVTQGIMSITMIPKITRYHPEFDYLPGIGVATPAITNMPNTKVYDMYPDWRSEGSDVVDRIPAKYRHLKKFLTSPYCIIEMTTFNATPVILKPEMWNNSDARIFERASLVPPGNRIEFAPRFYNSRARSENSAEDLYPPPLEKNIRGDDLGEYVDLVTQIANFPTMTIVNNAHIGYLASNVHGIAFQRQSADWSQQRALGMAQGNYDIASGAINTLQNLTDIANVGASGQTAIQNANIANQATVNAITGGIGGVAGGGAAFGTRGAGAGGISSGMDAIGSGINTGIQMATNEQAVAMANNSRLADTAIQNRQNMLARDTNKQLADWAAKGDYANQIAGISAKVQDAAMIQPTTSGQMGGETINLINGGWRLSLRFKMIDEAAIRQIGDFWLRYGYAIRSFIKMPANWHVMSKFTYWKLTETYIVSSTVPEGFKQAIRGVFEKGVTLYKNPADIGTVDIATNMPIEGKYY